MRIIEEKEFLFAGEQLIARIYRPTGKSVEYGEIVYKADGQRPRNMKNIARQYLKPHNVEISTDASVIVTHKAVKILMEYL